ncbi:MAG TPA: serine/threonine-protein kinase [Kofleriaceae bacterium]|nr:serine/threonine-protein kinase [Kofleriaceae bacterium]
MAIRAREPTSPEDRTITADEVVPATGVAFDVPGTDDPQRYALIAELARGGGGRIAIAIDRKLGRKVALKRSLGAAGDARLEREALVLAQLEHPSIVSIHDAGRDHEGSPFYTMKLVDGETLAARLARTASFDDRVVLLATVTTVADAMAYAHAQGVIHRDLKPGNVVIGAFGEVAVIDWGLGKLVDGAPPELATGEPAPLDDAALTGHSAVVGTPAYMAPEQASGASVDRRTDVYALGAMLYHVLTGDVPYPGADADATLAQVASGPPPAIDAREPRVPRDLAAIVGKAMARAPDQRYPSAAELADDLRRYQTGRLVAAHRYGLGTRLWRWLRRRQARVAAGAGAAAVIAAAATVIWAGGRAPADALCLGVDAPVRAVWNPAIAIPLAAAFAATGAPQAAASWRGVAAELDGRTRRIAEMRIAACRAARVTGEQSPATLDLRMTCLDRRTAELGNFVSWLGHADRTAVPRAADSAAALGRVDDCADVARLHDVMAMPADPARRAAIAAVEAELDTAMASARDGKYVEIARTFPDVVARAEATGYEPVRARALYDHAQLLVLQTRTAEILALTEQALTAAERAGADRLRADILTTRLHVELNTLEHVELAAALAQQVKAIGERVHDPEIESTALGYMSQIDLRQQHVADAIHHAEQALALIAEPDSRKGWSAQGRVGGMYVQAHRLADAERIFTRLIASRRAVIGDADDPNLVNDLHNLAVVYDTSERPQLARDAMAQAAAICDRTLPRDAKPCLEAHTSLAILDSELGHRTAAREALAALLPIAEAKLGHDHADVAALVFRIAEAREHEDDAGHEDDALAGYRDALARYTASGVPLWVAKCHGHIGATLFAEARFAEARPELEAALAALIQLRGEASPEAAIVRGNLGRVWLGLGDPRRAIAELARALASLDPGGLNHVDRGLYRTYLANAYDRTGDRAAARDQARQAHALLDASGPDGKDARDELATWERAHR